ncbi:NEP1-interacting protein 1 [Eucalyptus grandis]|uniref:NEP1-interacting protein 1 n=1 Tax=Eucalyptus grandis TaxID=71139 RepID=UPI00192F0249|nr:NEP1-interacting protein 1 [Eucalyptus grandis]
MGKAWVWCCDGVSAIVFAVSYVLSVFFLAIVGSTLGVFAGVLIGVKSQDNLFYSVGYGAIEGGMFLTNAFRMSISFWLSDDCSSSNVLHLTGPTRGLDAGEFVQRLLHSLVLSRLEQTLAHADNMTGQNMADHANVSKNSCGRIPRIRIAEDDLMDSSGNRNSCSICLQDFECKDEARRLPNCCHLFHMCCIDKWISKQRSCPLCRSPIV